MAAGLAVVLVLFAGQPHHDRLQRCVEASRVQFPNDTEQVLQALCLTALERNDLRAFAQERIEDLSTPAPPPRVVERTNPLHVASGALAAAILALLVVAVVD